MMPRKVIAMFVKEPVPGLVKTRLAADIGHRAACDVYCRLAAGAIRRAAASGFPLAVFYDGKCGGLPDEWRQQAGMLVRQAGNDLGERMAAAFCGLFSGNAEQAVIIGSDIPGIDGAYLRQAFSLLDEHDLAIGPATDGGYCLIGFRRTSFTPALFEGVRWSTDQVLHQTLEKAAREDLQVGLLPALRDIDTLDDLRQVTHLTMDASWVESLRTEDS